MTGAVPATRRTAHAQGGAQVFGGAEAESFAEERRVATAAGESLMDAAPAVPADQGSRLYQIVTVLGLLALLGRLVVQRRTARHIAREADEVIDPDWTALLNECAVRIGVLHPGTLRRSRVQLMPMTMGTVAPCIVVPADADAWKDVADKFPLLER